MTIQSLADHELRSLVRYGAPKFVALAQAELERRAKVKKEAGPVLAGPASQKGRWDT